MTDAPESSDRDDAKARVRAQYGAVGDAYVTSVGHATGGDLARMVELAAPQPTDTLLDIATGGGHVATTFAPHVQRVIATDLTPEILTHAASYFAELGLTNIETQIADAEELPFAEDEIDIVTCRIAPHHFPHPTRFVLEAARVLHLGGRFVLIDTTVPEGEAGEVLNQIDKLRDPSHVRSLSIDEWENLLTAAGFATIAVESFTKRHDFADWTARSRMGDDDRVKLEQFILDLPDDVQEAMQLELEDGHLVAFHDTKTLFFAVQDS